jgi:translocator protein
MARIGKWVGLGAWLILCYGVASVAGRYRPGTWYEQLAKPEWTPPDWVFAPVWITLYGLMAIAAWLVWKQKGFAGARLALGLFLFQLTLNLAWSWLFFGRQDIGLALADIVMLWVAILATTVVFWREQRIAAALLVPYLLWVTLAVALNAEIWRLN